MNEGSLENRDLQAAKRRSAPMGCSGLLAIALIVCMVLGARLGGTESPDTAESSEISEDLAQSVGLEEVDEEPITLPPPGSSATKPPLPTSTPTAAPDPLPSPTADATRAAGEVRSSIAHNPTPTPTFIPPAVTPTPEPTAVPDIDFTVELNPTPTDNLSITLKVPILMYHYVSVPPEDADKYRLDLSVTPEEFESQMRYLVENGFSAIDLYDLSLALAEKEPLPEKPVILTFDDGYLDNYQNAYPVLRELGLTATFFIATGFVDDGNPNYMDWGMIEEMAASGMRFEPHSKTHRDLRDRDRDFLIYEILGSQETLAAHTGYLPRFFAYPGGRYDQAVIDILTERDFWGAVTTAVGSWHNFENRYEWARQRVRNTTTLSLFSQLIS